MNSTHNIRSKQLVRAYGKLLFLSALLLVMVGVAFLQGVPAVGQNTPVTAEAIGAANLRLGPGVEYALLGVITAGKQYPVVGRYPYAPWLLLDISGRLGWVYQDLVRVTGDLNTVRNETLVLTDDTPITAEMANAVATAALPNATAPSGENTVLNALGMDLYNYLLGRGYVPRTSKQASIFVMNLQTGHIVTVNDSVAYSAASTMKIFTLLALYRKLETPPTAEQAYLIASMIVCSENTTSNTVLRFLGDGDELRGAAYVTDTINLLGLKNTYLARSYLKGTVPTPVPNGTPVIPTYTTVADQRSANPDPLNQTTPADLGAALAGIYQCAVNNDGSIIAGLENTVTLDECRQILTVMSENRGRNLLAGGVPDSAVGAPITVARKSGFDTQMHADAGVILTPGGDYVLVVMMNADPQISFSASFPIIGEISRRVYNAFNASRPLNTRLEESIPQCQIRRDLITTLQETTGPIIR